MALTTLTDLAAHKAKPKEKSYKLAAGGGLFLLVTPDGAKYWRLKYRFAGKEKLLALGVYQQAGGSKPEVGLAEAGELRDEAKKKLAAGIDPGDERRQRKLARVLSHENSFAAVAREWFDKHAKNWADTHADRIIRRLERDVFPWIGDRPVGEVTAPELLAVIRRIEERGALETAHRALGNCGQVFRYAVTTGRAERDPSGDLRGALPPSRRPTTPPSQSPRRWAPSCVPWRGSRARSSPGAPCASPRSSSRGRASCAKPSGPRSIWRPRSGSSPPNA
jgi:hypothetical protein